MRRRFFGDDEGSDQDFPSEWKSSNEDERTDELFEDDDENEQENLFMDTKDGKDFLNEEEAELVSSDDKKEANLKIVPFVPNPTDQKEPLLQEEKDLQDGDDEEDEGDDGDNEDNDLSALEQMTFIIEDFQSGFYDEETAEEIEFLLDVIHAQHQLLENIYAMFESFSKKEKRPIVTYERMTEQKIREDLMSALLFELVPQVCPTCEQYTEYCECEPELEEESEPELEEEKEE